MQQGPQMNPFSNQNPYAPPTGQQDVRVMGPPGSPEEAVSRGVCPRCSSSSVHQPSFTWWGGVLGPKLFNHWVCSACGLGYNGKTGQSNRGKIITYFVVINVAVLIVIILMNLR